MRFLEILHVAFALPQQLILALLVMDTHVIDLILHGLNILIAQLLGLAALLNVLIIRVFFGVVLVLQFRDPVL